MKRVTIRLAILVLSMPFVASTVKAQDKSAEISKLVQVLMASGTDWAYPNGFAQVVGLDKPMPAKVMMSLIGDEARKCHVVYESDDEGRNRPHRIYLVRAKETNQDVQERFFRVSLDGQLEKVVTLRNKLDDKGRAIREGRSKVEEDIDSPEIKQLFKTEMTFWLKDWLKKQQKLPPATPGK